MKRYGAFLIIAAALFACKPDQPATLNKFADPTFVKIADFQDRRLSDSLFQFLKNDNVSYRRDASLAFASIQDTAATDRLWECFEQEKDREVKNAIVYALGQTGKKFPEIITQRSSEVLREYLEAIGKVADGGSFQALVNHPSEDSVILEGKLWGIYRFALRNESSDYDSGLINATVPYLKKSHALSVRLGAAHVLSRGRMQDLTSSLPLLEEALNDGSPEIRMAVALALRKVKDESVINILDEIIKNDPDYRVRINAVRALQPFPFEKTKDILFRSLEHNQVNVGIAASEVIKATAKENDEKKLSSLAGATKNWRIQANLYEAALAGGGKGIEERIKAVVQQSSNPYQKAALITALQQSVSSFEFVNEQLLKADTPVVRSSAATALTIINKHKKFSSSLTKRFADIYIKAMQTSDAAVIGIIAGALTDTTLGYKNVIRDFSFLYDAKNKLSLPKDNEALQPLEAAIAYFEGKKKSQPVTNEFNNPIDWTLVKTIPKDQKVLIKTSKGDIIIRLFVEEAPGSVANFVALANQHYFDNKFFHRVVPNFVVQAGCNRGDGWGSEDYSIRSEFSPRRYKTGSVGIASAGKDTEGTQWFITHSPTPHLDGRYTIFAEVERGMEVVHQIEVGDQILEVKLF